MVVVANSAAATSITLGRARRGRPLTTWSALGCCVFRRSHDDADVLRRPSRRRPQRRPAHRPAGLADRSHHRWCCRHRCGPPPSGPVWSVRLVSAWRSAWASAWASPGRSRSWWCSPIAW